MENIDTDSLIYLIALTALLAGFFFAETRVGLGKMMRYALIWVLIFAAGILGVAVFDDLRQTVLPRQSVLSGEVLEVPRGPDGHFHISAELNGEPVDFLVDTGATDIVLSRQDALRVGLPEDLPYLGRAETAKGTVGIAFARVDTMTVGPVTLSDVPVAVNEGDLFKSLLGMDWLRQYERIEIRGDRLRLEP